MAIDAFGGALGAERSIFATNVVMTITGRGRVYNTIHSLYTPYIPLIYPLYTPHIPLHSYTIHSYTIQLHRVLSLRRLSAARIRTQ